jgi:hypothetical protein
MNVMSVSTARFVSLAASGNEGFGRLSEIFVRNLVPLPCGNIGVQKA